MINQDILGHMRSIYCPATRLYRSPTTLPIGSEDLIIHARLYALADKYFVKGLKEAVLERFKHCADESFKGEKFYEAANIVFSTTPDTDTGLREVIAKRVSAERLKYRMVDNDDLKKALQDIPGLAYWVMLQEEQARGNGSSGSTVGSNRLAQKR